MSEQSPAMSFLCQGGHRSQTGPRLWGWAGSGGVQMIGGTRPINLRYQPSPSVETIPPVSRRQRPWLCLQRYERNDGKEAALKHYSHFVFESLGGSFIFCESSGATQHPLLLWFFLVPTFVGSPFTSLRSCPFSDV